MFVCNMCTEGSGCGSVGRVVSSKSRGPWFESSHWQKIILNIFCQLYWKDENKEKEAWNGPFKKCAQMAFAKRHVQCNLVSILGGKHLPTQDWSVSEPRILVLWPASLAHKKVSTEYWSNLIRMPLQSVLMLYPPSTAAYILCF